MAHDIVDDLYDNLKEDGWVENGREDFRAFFLAPGEQGYKNRKALYDNLKDDGYVDSPTYEVFARRLGLQAAAPKQTDKPAPTQRSQQVASTTKPKEPEEPAYTFGDRTLNAGDVPDFNDWKPKQADIEVPLKPQKPEKPEDNDTEGVPQYATPEEVLAAFKEQSQKIVGDTQRMFDANKPENRAKIQALKMAGQIQGRKTDLPGLTVMPSQGEGGIDLGTQRKSLEGPKYYGTTTDAEGKSVDQWLMPDGSVTTDFFEADAAEAVARQSRLQREFTRRMEQNGLDVSKPEDVEVQKAYDRLEEINKEYALEEDERLKRLNEYLQSPSQQLAARGNSMISGLMMPIANPETQISEDEISRHAEKRALEQAIMRYNAGKLKKTGSFFATQNIVNAAHGVKDVVTDIDTYAAGMESLTSARVILGIKAKLDKGEQLTRREQSLMESMLIQQTINEQADVPHGYTMGYTIANMVPFMVQMYLNPTSAAGTKAGQLAVKTFAKTMAKQAGQRAAKNFVVKAATKLGKKRAVAIAKAIGVTAGDITSSMVLANTFQAPSTMADASLRHVGEVAFDEDGNLHFVNGEGVITAFAKAEAAAGIENYTEMLGAHFGLIGTTLGRGASKVARKLGGGKMLDQATRLITNIKASDFAKGVAAIESRAEWHGSFGEMLEEEAGIVLNSIITGDNKLSDLVDKEQQIDIALGVGVFGAFVSGIKTVGYPIGRYKARHRLESETAECATLFGDEWASLQATIDNADEKDLSHVLCQLTATGQSMTIKKANALIKYASALTRARSYNLAAASVAAEAGAPDQQQVEQSYDNGYNAEGAEMADAKNLFDATRQKAEETLDAEIIEQIDSNPVAALMEMRRNGLYSEDEIASALDYANAKAAYDGMQQRINDDIDTEIAQSDAMISARTNKTSAMIHPAIAGHDNRKVYIVGGLVVTNAEGTIDRDASDESLIIRDAATGELTFVDPKEINSVEEAIDPEVERAEAIDAIRQKGLEAATNTMKGTLAFNPGDVVTIENGAQATIVQPDDPKIINKTITSSPALVDENGRPREDVVFVQLADGTLMGYTKEQLQAFADAAMRERLDSYEAEKAAARANQKGVGTGIQKPQFALNDEFTILNDAGEPVRGSITGELDDDGTVEIYTEEPINGNRVNRFTPAELEEMFDTYNGEPFATTVAVPENANNVPNPTENPEIDAENSENPTGSVPKTEEQPAAGGANVVEYDDGRDAGLRNAAAMSDEKLAQEIDHLRNLGNLTDFGRGWLDGHEHVQQERQGMANPAPQPAEDAMPGTVPNSAENVPANPENVPNVPESGNIAPENIPQSGNIAPENIPQTENPAPNAQPEQPQSALSRIPLDEKGKPNFEAADVETAWDAIVEKTSNEKIAQSFADNMVANAEAALKKAEKTKTKSSTDIDEFMEAENERLAAIERAKVTLEHWKAIAGTAERRRAERRAAEDAEARRRAQERAEEEARPTDNGSNGSAVLDVNSEDGQDGRPGSDGNADGAEQSQEEAEPSDGGTGTASDSGQGGELVSQSKLFNYFAGSIKDLIELAKGTATGLFKKIVAPISERLQQDLASYGIEISTEYKHVIDNNAIRHTLKNHGGQQEEKRGQIPLTDSDFERIEDVVSNYDDISVEKGKRNNFNILYSKKYDDGTTIFVEEKRDGRKELAAITMWKKKNSTLTDANRNTTPISDLSEVSDRKVNNSASEKQVSGQESSVQPSDNKGEQTVKTAVEAASAQVNTDPTPGQKEAGNYKKGHVQIDGLKISIENPKGSVRTGTDADGKSWETEMKNTYGYILGTTGKDGDKIDVFLSDNPEDGDVYVVDQYNKTEEGAEGSFDEHKVMYGFADAESARAAYLSNYSEDWADGRKVVVTGVTREEFKKWLDASDRKTKPFAEYKSVKRLEEAGAGVNERIDAYTEHLAELLAVPEDGVTEEMEYAVAAEGETLRGELEAYYQEQGMDEGAAREAARDMLMEVRSQTSEAVARKGRESEDVLGDETGTKVPAQSKEMEADKAAWAERDRKIDEQVYGETGLRKGQTWVGADGTRVEVGARGFMKGPNGWDFATTVTYPDGRVEDTMTPAARIAEFFREKEYTLEGGETAAPVKAEASKRKETAKKKEKPAAREAKGAAGASTASDKGTRIEDFGEKIEGARKDMLKDVARSIENVTEQSLIELPLSKAFKRPNLKKLTDAGVISDEEAVLAEAIMQGLVYGKKKPVLTRRPSSRRELAAWASETYKGIRLLGEILSGDEGRKAAALEAREAELAERLRAENAHIAKLREWNPGREFADLESVPDAVEVMRRVLEGIGYKAGDKVELPLTRVEISPSGNGYSVSAPGKQGAFWFKTYHDSVDGAIKTMALAAKLARGDMDAELPARQFSVRGVGNQRLEPTGKYVAQWLGGKHEYDIKEKVFDSKEAAEEFLKDKEGRVEEQMRTTGEYDSYAVQARNPLTGKAHAVKDGFASRAEASAWLDGNGEEANTAALESIYKEMGTKGAARPHFYVSSSYDRRKGKMIFSVVADDKNNPWPILKDFDSRAEAEGWLKDKLERLETERRKRREAERAIVYYNGAGVRTGEDYRGGEDATAESFTEAFGFRSVQFGNWTNDADRQAALNQAYDALMDLAHLLVVPTRALSLDGELGLAFGARGGGSAAAHYEPVEVVINLTKTQGAGALAHEWWHALDNFLSRRAGVALGYASHRNGTDKMSAPVREAVKGMMPIINKSNYAKRSRDKSDYWGRGTEVMARLFESWAAWKLGKEGRRSPFLSPGINPKSEELYRKLNYFAYSADEKRRAELEGRAPNVMSEEEFKDTPESLNGYPYPTEAEIAELAPHVEALFGALAERESESGSMAGEPRRRYRSSQTTGMSLFDWADENERRQRRVAEADEQTAAAEEANGAIDAYAAAYKEYVEETARLEKGLAEAGVNDEETTAIREQLESGEDIAAEARERLREALRNYYVRENTPADAERIARDMVGRVEAEVDVRLHKEQILRDILDKDTPIRESAEATEAEDRRVKTGGGLISYNAVGHLPDAREGEFAYVERQFSRSGAFSFTGNEIIKDRGDVAYIFRALESYAVEHVFAVFVKDGRARILHIGMGGPAASYADVGAIRAGYDAFGADEIYLVHNHPSGTMSASPQDRNLMRTLEKAFGDKVKTTGIIMDTTSGRYVTFDGDRLSNTSERPREGGEAAAEVLQFDRVEARETPEAPTVIRSSQDVTRFVTAQRLGGGKKVSYLVVSNSGAVTGNFHTDYEALDATGLAEEIVSTATRFGGTRVVVYGNMKTGSAATWLQKAVTQMSLRSIELLDAVEVRNGHGLSARDEGYMAEAPTEYGAEAREPEDGYLYRTSGEIDAEYPNWLDGTTTESGRHSTQVEGTRKTYAKVGDWIERHLGKGVTILDASSGMGYGTADLRERGFDIEDVEPYQSERRKAENPATYDSYSKIDKQYDYIISNAVLNVIPDDWRRDVLHDMAGRLKEGGRLFINTRKAGEEKSIKDKVELDSPREVLVKRGGRISSYQRFFTPAELRAWVESELGEGYSVEVANEGNSGTKGLAAVVVTKGAEREPEADTTEREETARRVGELAHKLGLSNVDVVTDVRTLSGARARAKGFYNKETGRITIVLPNNVSAVDVEQTLLHEAVVHYGLRVLFGKRFDDFLSNVYEQAEPDVRRRITALAAREGWDFRRATEEYLAGLAEETDFERAKRSGWWSVVKGLFLDMIEELGFKGFRDSRGVLLSDNDLRYILWRSYENLKNGGGGGGMLAEAEDVARQAELGVGNYAEGGIEAEYIHEPQDVGALNERFDSELEQYERGELKTGHRFALGMPSAYLRSAGFPALPISMRASLLARKAGDERHPFEADDLRGLVEAMQKPIAIFEYSRNDMRNLIVDLKRGEKHFLVGVTLNYRAGDIEINSVSGLFPKESHEWVKWIQDGKAIRIDQKDKVQAIIDSLRTNPAESERIGLNLDGVANIVKKFDNPAIEDDILYRAGDFTPRDKVMVRDRYEKMVSRGGYQFQEAVQDSMLGLKKLYQAILGKDTRIEDVAGFENAYLFENRMSSMNAGEQHEYFQRYMRPLLEEIAEIAGANKRKRRELTDYIMAKHGLERNAYMRNEAAQNNEETDRDFAGLTGLIGVADWQSAEATAQQWVDDYESAVDTTALWQAINDATKATLEKIYLSGIISKETYEKMLGMYQFYIPLRGWDETTSEQVYGYLTSKDGPLGGSIIKKAEGRESMADDPIATIDMMADDAIRQGNRNLMKQRFLNFILNHPSDAVSVHDIWLEYDDVADEWRPVFADVETTDTPDEVAQKVEAFEQRMEALRNAEPDKYKKGREAQHVPYKVVKGNLREHQILIKRNGCTFVATINGNPRAAQALNGLTNPDVDQNGVVGNMLKGLTWVNRQLSAFYTTRNPDFVVGNFFRDMLYSNCMTWVKESPRYALAFHKNFGRVNPVVMRRLLGKWESGTLDMNNRLESLFYQFMRNGGETGYTNVRDIEGHKRAVAAELKKQGSVGRKAWAALGMQLDLLNRSAENCARFAAFITSRDFGRSIDRAIYDAKEISVNFNKKGSGGKMVNANGQTKLGKFGAYLSGTGRLLYVFWNVGVQSMTNFGRQAKLHPIKSTAGASALLTLGYIIPMLAEMLGCGDGDDDDKNAYYNLPEYIRRSNICFYAGEQWITIPLPIEYRAMYGMGELAHGVISGNERYTNTELGRQMAAQISQIMPLDMLEGGGGISPFIPSAAKPLTEAYIMNKSWTGLPIYKDTPFNKNDPEWTKAYASADKHLVDFAKWLNETSGGDDFKKGSIDINPAKIEYLLNGTFGGLFTFPNKVKKTGETVFGDRDFEWRNTPIANRLIKSGDERTANRKLQNEYFNYKAEYEETGRLIRKYENADERGVVGYAEKVNFMQNSDEYLRWEIFDEFKPDIDAYREGIATESNRNERGKIEAQMYLRMRELVNALHDPKEYFKELYDAGMLDDEYATWLREHHGINLKESKR